MNDNSSNSYLSPLDRIILPYFPTSVTFSSHIQKPSYGMKSHVFGDWEVSVIHLAEIGDQQVPMT